MNRKTFLKLSTIAVTATLIALWKMMINSQKKLSDKPVETRLDVTKLISGTYFFDRFIVVKSSFGIRVFSNKCTHAGCRINQQTDGQLICPCHGSRYDSSNGKVIQGPAGLSLSKIPFKLDAKTGEIVVIV